MFQTLGEFEMDNVEDISDFMEITEDTDALEYFEVYYIGPSFNAAIFICLSKKNVNPLRNNSCLFSDCFFAADKNADDIVMKILAAA